MVISSTPKQNCHSIGYQSYDQRRNDQIQKGNRMIRPYLAFPPLSWTFKSRGYINTTLSRKEQGVVVPFPALTISVITKDKDESAYPAVYSYPSDFLDN